MILRRLGMIVPMMVIASFLTFSLVLLIPGDPATRIAGESATPEQVEQVARDLGLDKPFLVQYANFVQGAVTGDLGTSYTYNVPVATMLKERLPVTLSLTMVALLFALLLGIPLGVIAGRYAGRLPDRVATGLTTLGLAVPNFALGLLMIQILAVERGMFPATGYRPMSEGLGEWFIRLVLPGLALSMIVAAEIARQLRASIADTLRQDYMRTATAKGLSAPTKLFKHSMRNALMPVVTVLGMQIAYLLGGTAVIEAVFGISGLGDFAVQAVLGRDLPAIQGIILFAVMVTLVMSLIVDISYGYLNPKVRRS
ncbi:ABC transporter permease [Nocardioides sp. AE5]|uniref:ABC transporter permease n=1 Tax=Nocardioides sp. AE5 TaxID=2962573 RepID=UPI002882068E|nr:ABC transporter permease [Nocardioides sp. AE5]MDT0203223.1 ABC transporter permease [Nocardioides sp. AE5]